MEALNRYLDDLAAHLPRDRALREAVLAEVQDHLRSRAAAWQAQGLSEAEAMQRAVEQFGPADEVGEALARVHRGGTRRQALVGAAPHLLLAAAEGLPALPMAFGGLYLSGVHNLLLMAFGLSVIVVLAVWGRRRRLWVAPWIGYGLAVALSLATIFWRESGLLLWLPLPGLVYFWLAYRDRLAGVLAAVPLVPVALTMLALDEVQPPLTSALMLATGLLAALATGVAIRAGDERRGILLLAAVNALVVLPANWAAIFHGQFRMVWIGFQNRITPASVTVSTAGYLVVSTMMLLGPLFCRALVDWWVIVLRETRGGEDSA